MLLEKIILEGFLSYTKRQEVDLQNVKTSLVLGRIDDDVELSNGAGKSSLFEAIVVNFFGKSSGRADLLDSYINDKMSKMYIEIIFKIDKQRFKTVRTKTRNSSGVFEVFLDSTNKELKESTWKKTDKTIEEILGLSAKTYSSTIYLNERESLQIITGTSSERKEILRELLNIDVYEKATRSCSKKFDDLDKKVQVNLNLIQEKQERLKDEQQTDMEFKSTEQTLKKANNDLKIKEKELENQNVKKQKLNILIETENLIKTQIIQANADISELSRESKDLIDNVEELEREVQEQTEAYKKKKKLIETLTKEKVSIDETIKKQESVLKELDVVDINIKELKQQTKTIAEEQVKLEKFIDITKTQQKPIESILKRLDEFDNICPITENQCSILKGDFKTSLKSEKDKEILALQLTINEATKQLEDVYISLSTKLKQEQALEKQAYSRQYENEKLSKAKLSLQSLVNSENNFKEKEEIFYKYLEDSKEEKKFLIKKSKKIEEKLKDRRLNVEQLEKKIDYKLRKEFTELETEIYKIEDDVKIFRSEIYQLNQEVGELKSKLDEFKKIKSDIECFVKANEENMKQKKIFQILSTVFGKDGIQKSIMKETIPILEKYTNEFLKIFNEDSEVIKVKFDLDPKRRDGELKKGGGLDILVLEEGKEPKDLQMYSGGETVRIVFSIVLSLAKLLSLRAGKKHETLIIDEKIAKLDTRGIMQFGDVIREISKIYNQVFIITHIESLKDMINGNEIIVNRTLEGGSLVSVL